MYCTWTMLWWYWQQTSLLILLLNWIESYFFAKTFTTHHTRSFWTAFNLLNIHLTSKKTLTMGASREIFCYIQLQKWFIHLTKKIYVVLLILRRCKCKLNKIISVRVTDILVKSDNNYDCKSAEVEYLHKITAFDFFFWIF